MKYKINILFFLISTSSIIIYLNSFKDKEIKLDISLQTDILIIFSIIFLMIISTLIHFKLKNNYNLKKDIENRTKELELEKNYKNAILDTNPDIIIVTMGKYIIDANKSFLKFFNYKTIEDFLKEHDCICDYFIELNNHKFNKDKKVDGKIWSEYIVDNLGINHTIKLQLDKDNIYFFNLNASRLSKSNVLVILTDVTDLTNKEKELFKTERLASMGEMIGNIAHQWRQPLSVISTSASGLKLQKEFGTLQDEFLYDSCDRINNNVQYLSKIIDDFRDFIKGDTKVKKFNLKNDIHSFIKLVDSTIKTHNINVILDLEENINIQGYPNELIQCFINIFNNAKDALAYIDENDRYIFISQSISDNKISIEFKDNAGGISEDILAKIFDPYFTTKHKSQGTGLGLNITYNLIKNGMRGDITAKNITYTFNNKEYKGASFIITLSMDDL